MDALKTVGLESRINNSTCQEYVFNGGNFDKLDDIVKNQFLLSNREKALKTDRSLRKTASIEALNSSKKLVQEYEG